MRPDFQKLIVAIAVGFVFGFGSAWVWLDRNTFDIEDELSQNNNLEVENLESDIDTDEDVDISATIDSSQSLNVRNQPAGGKVLIDKAVFPDYGWVVVYEEMDGEPGNILGAQLFDPRIGTSGHVELLRPTISNNFYYVIMQLDNGNRQFDYQDDLVLREPETGKIIMSKFKTE